MPNNSLVNIQSRHHVFLQRLGTGEVNRFQRLLGELRSGVLSRLSTDVTDFSRRRLEAQLVDLESFQRRLYNSYIRDLNQSIKDIAISESVFEQSALSRAVTQSVNFGIPSESQLFSALRLKPLSIGSKGAGKLLKPFIDDWSKVQIDSVSGIIRQGWVEGQTIQQMTSGVKSLISSQVKRTSEAIVRTSINHASQIARNLTWQSNDDIIIGWRFLAVLDGRTSDVCQGINSLNRVYDIGTGPQPPRHINCRSTSIPELDPKYDIESGTQSSKGASGGKQVDGDLTYFEWLKTQPKSFVHDSIGVGKGDLLLSGKMTAQKFAEFGLNKLFEALTLAEMVEKDKKFNLGLFPSG